MELSMFKWIKENKQVLTTQAEQANGKAYNVDNVPAFGKLILQIDIKNCLKLILRCFKL